MIIIVPFSSNYILHRNFFIRTDWIICRPQIWFSRIKSFKLTVYLKFWKCKWWSKKFNNLFVKHFKIKHSYDRQVKYLSPKFKKIAILKSLQRYHNVIYLYIYYGMYVGAVGKIKTHFLKICNVFFASKSTIFCWYYKYK